MRFLLLQAVFVSSLMGILLLLLLLPRYLLSHVTSAAAHAYLTQSTRQKLKLATKSTVTTLLLLLLLLLLLNTLKHKSDGGDGGSGCVVTVRNVYPYPRFTHTRT